MSDSTQPVTTLIARRVRPGMEARYEDWVRRIIDVSSTWPGHQSVDVVRPTPGSGGVYLLIVRFTNSEDQQAWQASDARAAFLNELSDITDGDTSLENINGLETWFTLPGQTVLPTPSKHKMAIVITVVVFFLVLGANLLFGNFLAQLPLVPRVAVLAIVQVALLSYVIMPRVTVLLHKWLFPS